MMARADIADAINVTDEVDETTDTMSGTNPMEYIARFREQSMRIFFVLSKHVFCSLRSPASC